MAERGIKRVSTRHPSSASPEVAKPRRAGRRIHERHYSLIKACEITRIAKNALAEMHQTILTPQELDDLRGAIRAISRLEGSLEKKFYIG